MDKNKQDLEKFFQTYFEDASGQNVNTKLDLLAQLVDMFRPKMIDNAAPVSLNPLIELLKNNNTYRENFAQYIKEVLNEKIFHAVLSDAGIPKESDFLFEIKEKLFNKFLPRQPEENNLEYILNQIFYKSNDPDWIEEIDQSELRSLFTLLEFKPIHSSVEVDSPLSELLFACEVMTLRLCGNALETKVMKMVPEYNNLKSPFVAFQNDLSLIEKRILNDEKHYINPDDEEFKHLFVLLSQCQDYVNQAFKNSKKFGISIRVNQSLIRIRRQLIRLEVTLPLLTAANENDLRENTINLGKRLIKLNCHKNKIKTFFDEGTRLLSYEITEQTAKTGEHYITKNRTDYFKMLLTSIGGGLVVGLMCVSKILLSKWELSSFGEAFFYSMNYSIGFIILYLLGFTLATKQPAMTASTLISALDKGMKNGDSKPTKHKAFAKLFSEVFRSQIVAFMGNLIMAFPVAMLVVYLVDLNMDYNIPEAKWEELIKNLNPTKSLAVLHAAIAGVFLFLSGIIAGVIANRNKFNNIYSRIGKHPFLKKKFGKKFPLWLAQFIENKWAGIMSNFWFGVFMGSTASIGIFLGLNLDIRHIAFSSGNFALGMYGAGFTLSADMIIWSLIGIFSIGFMNFWVSFGLSIFLAFRTRRIPLSEFKAIALSVFTYFLNSPSVFVWPPKEEQEEEDIKTKLNE
ncbi:recombinase [Belliella aquatica]|uniref:Recombinase n=1 Tax=Belliella aquatica TaxID=1323734 RepID=A0ABQ1MML0_9BACT|nr:recombinase [Belliella aquatica]MCH7406035.1 site-specific recombinase [Belliella aquatica]GGC43239.1 recombinase [Belliella aquatica]